MLTFLRRLAMPSMMKTLMDDFYDLQDKSDDFEYRIFIDNVVSYANNCHGMTAMDTLNSVESTIDNLILNKDNFDIGESGVSALEDAKLIVLMNREIVLNS